jgi:hypothetical protein
MKEKLQILITKEGMMWLGNQGKIPASWVGRELHFRVSKKQNDREKTKLKEKL